jgi:hypothetical protein
MLISNSFLWFTWWISGPRTIRLLSRLLVSCPGWLWANEVTRIDQCRGIGSLVAQLHSQKGRGDGAKNVIDLPDNFFERRIHDRLSKQSLGRSTLQHHFLLLFIDPEQ